MLQYVLAIVIVWAHLNWNATPCSCATHTSPCKLNVRPNTPLKTLVFGLYTDQSVRCIRCWCPPGGKETLGTTHSLRLYQGIYTDATTDTYIVICRLFIGAPLIFLAVSLTQLELLSHMYSAWAIPDYMTHPRQHSVIIDTYIHSYKHTIHTYVHSCLLPDQSSCIMWPTPRKALKRLRLNWALVCAVITKMKPLSCQGASWSQSNERHLAPHPYNNNNNAICTSLTKE